MMHESRWLSAVFSPTGGTAAIVKAITGGQGQVLDLSAPTPAIPVPEGAVVLAAVPVFGGRVPAVALERLAALKGSGPAVAVAVYGNRAYEDALLEVRDALTAGGFQVVAAAAFVAQHSIAPTIAQGRPDAADLDNAAAFGQAVLDKLAGPAPLTPAAVPGNTPYKDWKGISFHPAAGERCISCGLCAARCPVGAIPTGQPSQTDPERCVTCMRCVSLCPRQARSIPAAALQATTAMLEEKAGVPRQPEWFL
nr:4Fe-4S binding protein [uncultured Flavonifractor sp.]